MRSSFLIVARRAAATRFASQRAAAAPRPLRHAVAAWPRTMTSATKFTAASSNAPYAVDAPDGEHDLEDLEEHAAGVENIVEFAAQNEDANAINESHKAGATGSAFAVDAPDGEHDLEDLEEHGAGAERIIDDAAELENADEVKSRQELQQKTRLEAEKHLEHDL